jgi:hypothetical protein
MRKLSQEILESLLCDVIPARPISLLNPEVAKQAAELAMDYKAKAKDDPKPEKLAKDNKEEKGKPAGDAYNDISKVLDKSNKEIAIN